MLESIAVSLSPSILSADAIPPMASKKHAQLSYFGMVKTPLEAYPKGVDLRIKYLFLNDI
jgi:hypothetical protein